MTVPLFSLVLSKDLEGAEVSFLLPLLEIGFERSVDLRSSPGVYDTLSIQPNDPEHTFGLRCLGIFDTPPGTISRNCIQN